MQRPGGAALGSSFWGGTLITAPPPAAEPGLCLDFRLLPARPCAPSSAVDTGKSGVLLSCLEQVQEDAFSERQSCGLPGWDSLLGCAPVRRGPPGTRDPVPSVAAPGSEAPALLHWPCFSGY